MTMKAAVILAMTAACLATIAGGPTVHAEPARRTITVKHPPVVNPGDISASWSARQNAVESKQYERLLKTNPGFRQSRMRKECGPITDPELHKSCIASFNPG
jgi:hypothetical protein